MRRYLDALIQSYLDFMQRRDPYSDEYIACEMEVDRLRELQKQREAA